MILLTSVMSMSVKKKLYDSEKGHTEDLHSKAFVYCETGSFKSCYRV